MDSRRIFLGVAAATALLTAIPATAQDKAPIKLGAILSTTGGLASLGLAERDGVLLGIKTVNARGGVAGHPLKLILEDDGSNPDAAMSKINMLAHSEGVVAVIGPSGIAQTVAIGAITQREELPVLAFTGLGPAVEAKRNCVLHLTPAQELNARALLSYVRDHGGKKIGVLHDSGYGQVVWGAMQKLGPEFGVDFVAVEKFELSATDATPQAAKVKAAEPDMVIVLSSNATGFRNLRQVGLSQPIVSVHGTALYDVVRAMGDAADNVVHAEFLIAEDPQPYQAEFVKAFEAEYGRPPKHLEAAGWDAVMAVTAALEKTGPEPEQGALCEALRGPWPGAFAAYDFSAADMGGLTLASFNYSLLTKGQFSRLPYRAAD
ncbi:ABC transporter substrate-binding protein [Haematobacter massiliensis]|uniref:ABC transporter substrate-binding protein n=1 Tax=Haematobacter massiliensis TaxID=195105 RepID=A0A086Y6X4_9RHOB|nr:ABC transporter substrate-binding protein [Haematobacter massiliensis]KFI30024.1 ABC transporter substrate-binding protein [Haematobacter massiliensis]OWJ69383.1 ABC transporter substrate-binding protein [Haematobacter massiliensis]OWJ86960.1 ABC transporter substrate-binding protein [Haematobacter massiliensis]QBJ25530.1 ABC transporter substrate-binding protein [Haematobacter massiliensis]